MPLSNFPKGFSGGVTIQGLPILSMYSTSQAALTKTGPSGVYWVDNTNGLDGNPGTYQLPLKTLSRAVALSNTYDIVMLKPGHAETISTATALNLSVAGLTVVGLGVGTQRPTFTLDTATTTTITVSAANVVIENCIFVANFAAIVSTFTLTTAKGFVLNRCAVRDTSAILNFLTVITTSTTTAANDDLVVTANQVVSATATAATNFISFLGTQARPQIVGNYYHAVTTDTGAVMPIATGKVITDALIDSNVFMVVQTTGVTTGILVTTDGTTNSGMICRNFIQGLDATSEILVTASSGFVFSQNYYAGVADKSGYLLPAADA